MIYAQVKNNAIQRINVQLPTVIDGVSIPAGAANLGVFDLHPMIGTEPAYDTKTQRLSGPSYAINGSAVERIYAIEDIPIEEITKKIQDEIVSATQSHLDAFAKERNYDGILSACTYASSTIPKFAAEGQYAVDARDQTWAALYSLLGEVQAGTRPMPAQFSDVESSLPTLQWPN